MLLTVESIVHHTDIHDISRAEKKINKNYMITNFARHIQTIMYLCALQTWSYYLLVAPCFKQPKQSYLWHASLKKKSIHPWPTSCMKQNTSTCMYNVYCTNTTLCVHIRDFVCTHTRLNCNVILAVASVQNWFHPLKTVSAALPKKLPVATSYLRLAYHARLRAMCVFCERRDQRCVFFIFRALLIPTTRRTEKVVTKKVS